MIEKMKKITFLVFHGEYEKFLEQIRDIGVIHVQELQNGVSSASDSLESQLENLKMYNSILEALKGYDVATPCGEPDSDPVSAYGALVEGKRNAEARIQELQKVKKELEPWGEFDPSLVLKLKEAGFPLSFWKCSKGKFDSKWEGQFDLVKINEDRSYVYFVVAGALPEAVSADKCPVPETSLSSVVKEIEETENYLDGFGSAMGAFAAANAGEIENRRLELSQKIDLEKVKLNTEHSCEDKLMILQGWIPQKKRAEAEAAFEKLDCMYQVSDPTPDDDIPIQMSNNKFFKLFEPLTKLYMLPAYGEMDLTPFFAPFFMLFFGLCLGDMGYGLLMILAMPIFDKLFKLINPDFSKWLVLVFGGSTMLCGLLTGTAFGFSLYDIDIPFFKSMKEIFYVDNSKMFILSLIIGCVQILFGMCIKVFNRTIQLGFKYALSTIGWIILLVTCAVAALTGVGFSSIPVIVLLCIAGVLIFFFNSPGKNPFLNVGLGLWDSYNMVTGLLGDVLSYVRLFALGLSGSILASVFNSLAVGMSPKVPVLGFLVTAIIFLAGHAINIFMNFLGAIVHPMRLTFVEFFKNAGYTGGGKEYKPFANAINNQ